MEKKYHFKLKLQGTVREPILNIKPVSYRKKSIPYPINFSELNVPIVVDNRNYSGDSFDLGYFLDFENGFDQNGERQDLFKSKNLIRLLSDFNVRIDEDLRKALCFESKLKPRYSVIISDGSSEGYPGRFGNPRTVKHSNGHRNLKGRLD